MEETLSLNGLQKLSQVREYLSAIGTLDSSMDESKSAKKRGRDAVTISTIHKAKGKEWKYDGGCWSNHTNLYNDYNLWGNGTIRRLLVWSGVLFSCGTPDQ